MQLPLSCRQIRNKRDWHGCCSVPRASCSCHSYGHEPLLLPLMHLPLRRRCQGCFPSRRHCRRRRRLDCYCSIPPAAPGSAGDGLLPAAHLPPSAAITAAAASPQLPLALLPSSVPQSQPLVLVPPPLLLLPQLTVTCRWRCCCHQCRHRSRQCSCRRRSCCCCRRRSLPSAAAGSAAGGLLPAAPVSRC